MPVERWSTAQVEALAPDPGSLRNARGVTGQFTATGLTGDVLWGLCRGYQVAADLAGPAFTCSCPSRKIPCKHVLGLLLHWSSSGAGDHPAPPFATGWQTSRAARAKARASVPDPVAAAKRAQGRADRVAGGMAELRRWLDDQIEQGLAAAGRSGPQAFEAMAARLVDAQAPGVAGAVRRLGGVAGIGPHWADRLLGELALLRLLVSGHSRLDTLDPALAATVRSRIGFPTTTEEVLAGPQVTDRWQVLGQVESDDGALTSRRTWLHGSGSGRFALLLSFAAPGQPLPPDPVPGTEFRGALCFYPGAAPLRALVADQTSAASPFGSPAGAGTIRAALSRSAALLAAEPWRFDAPMLLSDVTPAAGGHLVDAEGSALPLAPGHREPWWLLAAAGATPATVAAEWSPNGLRPLAAWVDGAFMPAGPPAPDPGSRREAELPPELLTAALVGTGRRPWAGRSVRVGSLSIDLGSDAGAASRPAAVLAADPAAAPGPTPAATPAPTNPAAAPVPAAGAAFVPGEAVESPAAALLEAAAVALTCRRAGVEPATGHEPLPAAPAETDGPLPAAASARLARILDGGAPGGGHHEQELLAQWLTAAAARGGIVPPAILPGLLDAGRRNTSVRPELARVAGRRGAWLAGQRADWRWLLTEAAPALAGDWATASTAERLGHLAALRHTDPGAARELLESTWAEESSETRARFLGTFGAGLSPQDEPLLERALDDRRKEVREVALDLLRHLPGAELGRRMATRAHAAVRLDGSGRLTVEPPTELDRDLRRDGVGATPIRGIGVGAWLLEEVVAGTPLDTWTGLDPAGWLAAARGHDWANPLLHGWAKAAVLQRDASWASALLAVDSGILREAVRWDLHLVLPPDRLARLAAEALRSEDGSAQRLLALHPGPWPDGLSVAVLESVEQRARTDRHTWQLGELCRAAGLAMPPDYADLAGRLAARLDQIVDPTRVRPVTELARTLTFRHEMLQELR
ncbi:SWIM zinc finger family protein [Actinoplanes sp. NEAU-A12]|uniref:SWIM zinc finger family protein n=1 Tax=Actinoplanes sandaracinus TaxID=3045177 RepID=A0ABT6WPF9_9ACTN|nr:SWIM zinc finger family protein [Actinoplanes sandaracinus]MDI6101605.1 SWIM zinc finger family protein [Actinoplanes sandaracinus]